ALTLIDFGYRCPRVLLPPHLASAPCSLAGGQYSAFVQEQMPPLGQADRVGLAGSMDNKV
ncbi:MAG: hypothetical protein D6773_00675, partial [Alphaproteobacteria bacterium]